MNTQLAVYLVAGRGSRLFDKTAALPKCLIPINGEPLLIRSMNQLAAMGFKKIILVIGYEGGQIMDTFGDQWNGMEITYIKNKDWHRTNNVVSLAMVIPAINENFLLLEGDLIYSNNEIEKISMKKNSMAIAPLMPHMKGTTVSMDQNRLINQLYMKSLGTKPELDIYLWKTVNIYHFIKNDFLKMIQPELKRLLKKGNKQCYYEQAIALAVEKRNIEIEGCVFDNENWYEIDTIDDLFAAEKIFTC